MWAIIKINPDILFGKLAVVSKHLIPTKICKSPLKAIEYLRADFLKKRRASEHTWATIIICAHFYLRICKHYNVLQTLNKH